VDGEIAFLYNGIGPDNVKEIVFLRPRIPRFAQVQQGSGVLLGQARRGRFRTSAEGHRAEAEICRIPRFYAAARSFLPIS
jgi:hypothetical protein